MMDGSVSSLGMSKAHRPTTLKAFERHSGTPTQAVRAIEKLEYFDFSVIKERF